MSTQLLLHCNEPNGSQQLFDASGKNRLVVAQNSGAISRTQYKQGGALRCSKSTTDFAKIATSVSPTLFALTAMSLWTIDWWQRLDDFATEHGLFMTSDATGYGFGLGVEASTGKLIWREGYSYLNVVLGAGTALTAATWQHLALRCNGTIGTIEILLNGSSVATRTITGPGSSVLANSGYGTLGAYYNANGSGNRKYTDGYFDEFRVTHDAALDFSGGAPTPPYVSEVVSIAGINPAAGSNGGGTPVTILGSGFSGSPTVTIGGASATSVVLVDDTRITCVTPSGTNGARDVAVTV